MPIQEEYGVYHASRVPGVCADASVSNIASNLIEGASVVPAKAVVRGSASGQVSLPAAVGDTLVGVAVHSLSAPATSAQDNVEYAAGEPAPICDKGRVFVTVREDVVHGETVYIATVAAGDIAPGDFVASDNAANAPKKAAGWRYEESGNAGDIVEISIGYYQTA